MTSLAEQIRERLANVDGSKAIPPEGRPPAEVVPIRPDPVAEDTTEDTADDEANADEAPADSEVSGDVDVDEGDSPTGNLFSVEVDIDTLKRAVGIVKRAITRSTLPSMSMMRLETGTHLGRAGMWLIGTNREVTVNLFVPCNVMGEGATLLDHRILDPALKGKGTIALSADEAGSVVEARAQNGWHGTITAQPKGSSRIVSVSDWPTFEFGEVCSQATWDADTFMPALAHVMPATSKDQGRPLLTGVSFQWTGGAGADPDSTPNEERDPNPGATLILVSTDSYRLAVAGRDGSLPASLAVGGRAGAKRSYPLVPGLHHLVKAWAVKVKATKVLFGNTEAVKATIYERYATFTYGNLVIHARLIEGTFPNWRVFFDTKPTLRLVVDRKAMIEALRSMKGLAEGELPVRIYPTARELRLVRQDHGDITLPLPAEVLRLAGDELSEDFLVAFNVSYLLDAFLTFTEDHLYLDVVNELKPALIHFDGGYEWAQAAIRM